MPKGGRASKRKGNRGEREFCNRYGAERVPLSGAAGGSYSGDVVMPYLGRGEIKRRRDGFRQLYGWLGNNDFLALRADRKPWLVVMQADDLKQLLDEMDELKRENARLRGGYTDDKSRSTAQARV